MTVLRLKVFVLLLLLFCSLPVAEAADRPSLMPEDMLNLSLGLGLEYETGDYGTDTTIDTWRIPLILEWAPNAKLGLSLEIPFIRQSATGETVMIGGVQMPRRRGETTSDSTITRAIRSSESESGLGDVTLDMTIGFLRSEDRKTRLLGLLYAKLPTADEEKGLGTGEFDWGAGLGIGKKIDAWSFYGEALAIQPGDSADYDPDSYVDWSLSLSYRVDSALQTGVSLSGGTSAFPGVDDPLEIKLRLGGFSGERSSYSLYLGHGLSDSSPDWSLGITGFLDF